MVARGPGLAHHGRGMARRDTEMINSFFFYNTYEIILDILFSICMFSITYELYL